MRDITFASELMRVTGGCDVKVSFNLLTGDLLDESWSRVASSGPMVELGKRDMLDCITLKMEPFAWTVSSVL